MKTRRNILTAIAAVPAVAAAQQKPDRLPEAKGPSLHHDLKIKLTFGEEGVVRAEFSAARMPAIGMWDPDTGPGLTAYRVEMRDMSDGEHYIFLPQPFTDFNPPRAIEVGKGHPRTVEMDLRKVAVVRADNDPTPPERLAWLYPKGLPDELKKFEARVWYRAISLDEDRLLARRLGVSFDTFVSDWHPMPAWTKQKMMEQQKP